VGSLHTLTASSCSLVLRWRSVPFWISYHPVSLLRLSFSYELFPLRSRESLGSSKLVLILHCPFSFVGQHKNDLMPAVFLIFIEYFVELIDAVS
jgi:hypothetical protein